MSTRHKATFCSHPVQKLPSVTAAESPAFSVSTGCVLCLPRNSPGRKASLKRQQKKALFPTNLGKCGPGEAFALWGLAVNSWTTLRTRWPGFRRSFSRNVEWKTTLFSISLVHACSLIQYPLTLWIKSRADSLVSWSFSGKEKSVATTYYNKAPSQ